MKIKGSQKSMRGLRLVGEEENGNAFSLYGPVKAGLTTTHRTREAQLSELLSSLEREVENLHSRYCEVYVILVSVMEHLAKLGAFTNARITIDNEKEKE
jgi:hypothetical protein